MTVSIVQSMTVLPGVNEQTGASPMTLTGVQTALTKEYRELSNFKRGTFFLDVSAATGTSPTLDATIEGQDPLSLKWVTVVTFAQQTAANGSGTVDNIAPQTIDLVHSNYRARYVVGGTTPVFTFTCGVRASTEEPLL